MFALVVHCDLILLTKQNMSYNKKIIIMMYIMFFFRFKKGKILIFNYVLAILLKKNILCEN